MNAATTSTAAIIDTHALFSADTANTAKALRRALLELHRALIEYERRLYEKDHGRQSAADFLQVLTRDATYDWLEPLSGLILQFDAKPRAGEAAPDPVAIAARARALLRREPDAAEPFSLCYTPILDVSPDVALAHMHVIAALRHI
jgi:hypothetical protein